MMRSCSCMSAVACVIEIPGSAVGMYSEEPSYSGGMNWLPSLKYKRDRDRQKDQDLGDDQFPVTETPAQHRQIDGVSCASCRVFATPAAVARE